MRFPVRFAPLSADRTMENAETGSFYKVCPSVVDIGWDWSIEVILPTGTVIRDAGWKRNKLVATLTAIARVKKVIHGHSIPSPS